MSLRGLRDTNIIVRGLIIPRGKCPGGSYRGGGGGNCSRGVVVLESNMSHGGINIYTSVVNKGCFDEFYQNIPSNLCTLCRKIIRTR